MDLRLRAWCALLGEAFVRLLKLMSTWWEPSSSERLEFSTWLDSKGAPPKHACFSSCPQVFAGKVGKQWRNAPLVKLRLDLRHLIETLG